MGLYTFDMKAFLFGKVCTKYKQVIIAALVLIIITFCITRSVFHSQKVLNVDSKGKCTFNDLWSLRDSFGMHQATQQ